MESLLDDVDSLVAPDLSAEAPDWCMNCQALRQEINRLKEEQRQNFGKLKQKIISTDLLIKKYRSKCDDYDQQSQRTEEANKRADKFQRQSEILETQLKAALLDTEPLRKTKCTLEAEIQLKNAEIQLLSDKLLASEGAQRQYEHLSKATSGDLEKLETEKKELLAKLKLLESGKVTKEAAREFKNEISTLKKEKANHEKNEKRLEAKLSNALSKIDHLTLAIKENKRSPASQRRRRTSSGHWSSPSKSHVKPPTKSSPLKSPGPSPRGSIFSPARRGRSRTISEMSSSSQAVLDEHKAVGVLETSSDDSDADTVISSSSPVKCLSPLPPSPADLCIQQGHHSYSSLESDTEDVSDIADELEYQLLQDIGENAAGKDLEMSADDEMDASSDKIKENSIRERSLNELKNYSDSQNNVENDTKQDQKKLQIQRDVTTIETNNTFTTVPVDSFKEIEGRNKSHPENDKLDQKYLKAQSDVIRVQKCNALNESQEVTVTALTLDNGFVQKSDTEIHNHGDVTLNKQNVSANVVAMDDTMVQALKTKKTEKDTVVNTFKIISPSAKRRLAHVPNQHCIENKKLNEKFSSNNIDSLFSRKGTHLSKLGDTEHPETFKDCHQKETNNQGKRNSFCLDSEFSSCNLMSKQIHRDDTDELKPMLDDIIENLSDSDIEEVVKLTAEFSSNGNLCNVNDVHKNNTESSGQKTLFVATPINTAKSKTPQKSEKLWELETKNEKQIFFCDDKQSEEVIVLQPSPARSHLQRHPGQFDMKEEITKLPEDVESFKLNALAKRTEFKKGTTKPTFWPLSFVTFVKSSGGTLADEIQKLSGGTLTDEIQKLSGGTVADEIQNLCAAENDYEILDRDSTQKSVCKSSPNSERKLWKNKLKKKRRQLREKCKYKSLDDKLDERVIVDTVNKTNNSRVMDDVIGQSENLDENAQGSNKINYDYPNVRNLNIKLKGNVDHNPSLVAAVSVFNTYKMGSEIFEKNAPENVKESSMDPFQTERQIRSSGGTNDLDTCLNQKTYKSFHNYSDSATVTENSSLFKVDEVKQNVLETGLKKFEGSCPKNLSKEINKEGENMDVTLKTNLKNDAVITYCNGIPDNDDCSKINEGELNDVKQLPTRQISLGFIVNTSSLERSSSTDSSKSWKMSPVRLDLEAFDTIAEENNTEAIDVDTPLKMKNKTYNKSENVNLIFDVDDLISSGTVSEVKGKDCKPKQVHSDTNFPHLSWDKDTFAGNKTIKEISECDEKLFVSMTETNLKLININEKQQSHHASVLPHQEEAIVAEILNNNVKPSINKFSFKPINIPECDSESSLQSATESTTPRSLTPSLASPDRTSPVSPLSLSIFGFIAPVSISPIPPSPVQENDRDSPLSPILETFEIESSAEPVTILKQYINTEVSHSMSAHKFVDTNKIDLKCNKTLSVEFSKDIGKEKIEGKKYLGVCQLQINENSGNLLESNHCVKSELRDISIVENVLKEASGDRNVLEEFKGIKIAEVNGSAKIISESAAIVEKSLQEDYKSIESVLEDNGGNVPAEAVIIKQSTHDKTPVTLCTSNLDKNLPSTAFLSPLRTLKCQAVVHSKQQTTASDFEMAASHSNTKLTKTSSFACVNTKLNHDLVSGPLPHVNDVAINMDNVSQKIVKKKTSLKILESKRSTEKPKKFSPNVNKQLIDTSEDVKSKEIEGLSNSKREHNVRCSPLNEKSVASLNKTKINIASKTGIEKEYAATPVKKQELLNQNLLVINKLKDDMETDERGDNLKVDKQVLEALPSGQDNWAFKRKTRLAHKPNIPLLKQPKIQLIETPVLPPPKPSRKRQSQDTIDHDGLDKRPRKENVFQKQKNVEVETKVAKSTYTREDTRKMHAFLKSSVTAESMLARFTGKSERVTEGYKLIDTCTECLSRVMTDPLEIIYRECLAGNLVKIVTEFLFLSNIEKRAVYLFKYLIDEANLDITKQIILKKLWDSIFSRDVTSSIIGKMSLCRVFVALCALQADVEHPRVLFYHIITCGHLNGWQFVVPVVSVWPAILSKNQNDSPDKVLTHGMILVLEEVLCKALSTQDTEIRKKINVILQKLCNWTCETGNSDRILKILVTKLAECFEEQGNSGCEFELVKAIELLSVREGWSWFKEQFINRNGLQSVVNKYIAKNILKPVAPGYACAVLKITGTVMNALSETIRSKDYQQIIKNWLMPFLTKQPGVATVRECCLETFIELSPLHPALLGNLHKWFTSYKGHISNDVIARIEQIRILYQFKFGMHSKSFKKME